MVSFSDAAKTVTLYRANYHRDIEQAEEIWNRLDDPSLSGQEGPLRGRTEKAIWCAKKGKGSIGLSKKYGISKAAQVMRSDSRRVGGPIICATDPEADFENAVSNFGSRRKWQPTLRQKGGNGGSSNDTNR